MIRPSADLAKAGYVALAVGTMRRDEDGWKEYMSASENDG